MKEKHTISFSKYEKLAVLLLALTQFTVVLDFMVMAPLGDLLSKSMQLSPKDFGLIVSAYAFSAGVSGLLTAGFADRFDRKKILLFFYIGFIIGTFFCGIANDFWSLFVARILTGLFGGVMGSISMAIITDLFSIEKRGRAMGFIQMGFGASQVLGIPIGLYIANIWGWEAPFLLIVVLAILILLLLFIYLKPVTAHLTVKDTVHPFTHFITTLLNKSYLMGFLATAVIAIGGFMMMPYGTIFAVNNLGVPTESLPLLFMAAGGTSLFLMPIVGQLSDRVNKVKLFALSTIALIVICVIYTRMRETPFYVVLFFNIVLTITIISRMIPSTTLISAVPELKDRGAFMSINASLQQIAGGVAAVIGGFIIHQKDEFSPIQNYDVVGVVVSITAVFSILLMVRVGKLVKGE